MTQLCTSFAHNVGALSREYHKLSLGPCKWEVAAQYFGEQTPEHLKASCRPIVTSLDARLLELQKQVRVTKDELHQTQETGAAALKSHKLEIERYKVWEVGLVSSPQGCAKETLCLEFSVFDTWAFNMPHG